MSKIKRICDMLQELQNCVTYLHTDLNNKFRNISGCKCYDKHREEMERLQKSNTLLIQALCKKYNAGTLIIYDEHTPRIVTVIKDGEAIDMGNAQSLDFRWYKGEFPTLEVAK